jgi:methylmalonyl-CoA/ethylmalonyl-CoA epimerase
MAEPSHAKVKVSELYQVGIVVQDLEKSMEHYQNTFGIGPWGILNIDSSMFSEMTYHGRPVQHSFKAALAMLGPMQLELIQPLEGDNIFSDFLKEHGEGVHHLGHVRVNNMAEAIQTLEKEGFSCLQSGRTTGGGYAYIDTVNALGTIIELLEMPEGVPVPGRD